MVPTFRFTAVTDRCRRSYLICGLFVALVNCICFVSTSEAQQVHYRHRGDMPPGAIGQWQLQRGGPLPGYFQPTEIIVPTGSKVSLVSGFHFDEAEQGSRCAGFLIGKIYRLKVTHIPLYPGVEIFPTIELIDRIYPPPGRILEFPVPIQITANDLKEAVRGRMVTRVIYIEDPGHAIPARQQPGQHLAFDVRQGEDPLKVADSLGRPIAILRLGARVPGPLGPSPQFLYGSPAWKQISLSVNANAAASKPDFSGAILMAGPQQETGVTEGADDG